MAQSYVISDVGIPSEESAFSMPKNVTLKVGNLALDHISKCTERSTDLKTLSGIDGENVLNECYIDLTLEKLRQLDGDRYAQDSYILARSKHLDRGMINVLVIALKLSPGDVLEDFDYDYLNSLLQWKYNSMYLMPILKFDGEVDRTVRPAIYFDFVERMLQAKPSWFNDNMNVGMSVPTAVPRRGLGRLFSLYDDQGASFVGIDFDNSRMDRPSDVTGTVLSHFRELDEEKTFLYGINVKPYRKGADASPAWDMYMVHGSFNAIGPPHAKPRPVTAPEDWSSVGRIFDVDNIMYPKIGEENLRPFAEWMEDTYGIRVDRDYTKNGHNLYAYLKRYNFQKANSVLVQYSRAIMHDDQDALRQMREAIPEEMKGEPIIKSGGNRRLDEFLE